MPNLKYVLIQKWHLIQNQPFLRQIFKVPPITSFKKGTSFQKWYARKSKNIKRLYCLNVSIVRSCVGLSPVATPFCKISALNQILMPSFTVTALTAITKLAPLRLLWHPSWQVYGLDLYPSIYQQPWNESYLDMTSVYSSLPDHTPRSSFVPDWREQD